MEPAPIPNYTSVRTIMVLIYHLNEDDFEHKFKGLANSLLTNYFPLDHGFVVEPESRTVGGGTPDFGIFHIMNLSQEYCYAEVKASTGTWDAAESQLGSTMACVENPCYGIILLGWELRFYFVDQMTTGHGFTHGLIPIVPAGWPTSTTWHLKNPDNAAHIDQLFRQLGSVPPATYADSQ